MVTKAQNDSITRLFIATVALSLLAGAAGARLIDAYLAIEKESA